MHQLIVGRTLSGKTTLATLKARAFQKQGIKCLVLDPFCDPRWIENSELVFVTSKPDDFLRAVWQNTKCAVFVDEAGDAIGKYSSVMDKLATRGRHFGHKCHFIMQRSKQISTTIRTQCSDIAIFKQSLNDTKDLADEFVEPMINEAHKLNKGEFILVRDNKPTIKLNVFELCKN